MEPYSKISECAKCGHIGASSEWRPSFYFSGLGLTAERIARKCTNCGYSWEERPLPSNSVQPEDGIR